VIIEHNMDVIKTADWVIDLGPEGGHEGGRVIASGTPEDVARQAQSFTGQFLARVLNGVQPRSARLASGSGSPSGPRS
jgi:excinuclease ABC subunit A